MRLHWYNSRNFGDALSLALVEHLSKESFSYAHPREADIIATGSVLFAGGALFVERRKVWTVSGAVKMARKMMDIFQPPLHIWGAGFLIDPEVKDVILIRRAKVCAVRGERTLLILKQVGLVHEHDNVALGDPGLLYADLLPELPKKQYDLGIVPHFRDMEAGICFAEEYRRLGVDVKVVDVMQRDPLNTIRDIAACDVVLSSSLHGLIVADSLGIPNRHIVWSTLGQTAKEHMFKFDDYYSIYPSHEAPIECRSVVNYLDIIKTTGKQGRRLGVDVAKAGLVRSFPFSSSSDGEG